MFFLHTAVCMTDASQKTLHDIQLKMADLAKMCVVLNFIFSGSDKEFIIKELKPGTQYKFR